MLLLLLLLLSSSSLLLLSLSLSLSSSLLLLLSLSSLSLLLSLLSLSLLLLSLLLLWSSTDSFGWNSFYVQSGTRRHFHWRNIAVLPRGALVIWTLLGCAAPKDNFLSPDSLANGVFLAKKILSQGYIFLPKSLTKGVFFVFVLRKPLKIGISGLNQRLLSENFS